MIVSLVDSSAHGPRVHPVSQGDIANRLSSLNNTQTRDTHKHKSDSTLTPSLFLYLSLSEFSVSLFSFLKLKKIKDSHHQDPLVCCLKFQVPNPIYNYIYFLFTVEV